MGFLDFLFGKSERKEGLTVMDKQAIDTAGDYEVILQSKGVATLQVCKILNDNVTKDDLKLAKSFVDNAPCVIKKGVSQHGAAVLQKELEKAGATVVVQKLS
jgi:ribosomal protein L7/L12